MMTITEKPFWLDTVEIPTPAPHEFPQRVDVAIIGAGFTGLSAARSFARGGAFVAVVESRTIGWGAPPHLRNCPHRTKPPRQHAPLALWQRSRRPHVRRFARID